MYATSQDYLGIKDFIILHGVELVSCRIVVYATVAIDYRRRLRWNHHLIS